MPNPDLPLTILQGQLFFVSEFPMAKANGYNWRKRGEMAEKKQKNGHKQQF